MDPFTQLVVLLVVLALYVVISVPYVIRGWSVSVWWMLVGHVLLVLMFVSSYSGLSQLFEE